MKNVIACIDGSANARSVTDAAVWASAKLNKTLMLLHTLEKTQQHGADDLSGAIGLGARSSLLESMVELDEQRAKLALEHGKQLLEAARAHAESEGASAIEIRQRHGDIIESLVDLQDLARMYVLGRSGEDHQGQLKALGSHIDTAIRALQQPILVTTGAFTPPSQFMIAYDGRETANAAIQRIMSSDLLKGLPCHLVMIQNSEVDQEHKLAVAKELLEQNGFNVHAHYLQGEIFESLKHFQSENGIDLVVIGAFSHSSVRRFFLGSTTLRMISEATTPVIVLR